MAQYPAKEPQWADGTEGHDVAAWEDAKAQCRRVLYEWARLGRFGTYSELYTHITAVPWPEKAYTHHGGQMGTLLGQVSMEELDRMEDRPVLSALVVGADGGRPTAGFWKFLNETLGVSVGRSEAARDAFWVAEFKRACAYYGLRSA